MLVVMPEEGIEKSMMWDPAAGVMDPDADVDPAAGVMDPAAGVTDPAAGVRDMSKTNRKAIILKRVMSPKHGAKLKSKSRPKRLVNF